VITTRDQWDQWGSRDICRKKADTFTEAHYNVNTSKGGLVFPVLVGWPHYVRHYEKCWVYHTELYTHSSQIWASFTFFPLWHCHWNLTGDTTLQFQPGLELVWSAMYTSLKARLFMVRRANSVSSNWEHYHHI